MNAGFVLPDLLADDLDVVFCGTAAGKASAAAKAYYAHRGNRFWWALHQAGLTERQLAPAEFPLLLGRRLGLTDLAKHVSGNDDQIAPQHFDAAALTRKIERHRPAILAFTSKAAARAYLRVKRVEYGLQPAMLGRTRVFVLTSPSGAASASWRLDPWRELAALRCSLLAAGT